MLRPSRLHNLQQNLRNYVLRDLLLEKDDDKRERIIQVVVNKLRNQHLITVDEHDFIEYHIDNEAILLKIQRYILNAKPNNYADFQAAVKNRADILGLLVTDGDIQAFARHLREQNLIRQSNGKIEYAPFSKPQKQPEKAVYQPNDTIWEKVVAAISVAKNKRPSKLSSLLNVIKSHSKCNHAEVQQLLRLLQDKKYIQLNDNKVIYIK